MCWCWQQQKNDSYIQFQEACRNLASLAEDYDKLLKIKEQLRKQCESLGQQNRQLLKENETLNETEYVQLDELKRDREAIKINYEEMEALYEVTSRNLIACERSYECKICLNDRISTYFIPCGHAVCCKSCSNVCMCPICNESCENVGHIYFG